ncbi:SPC34 (YKR037C) [Zygosaccharomyces parabailii]|nr:SPC34 (YKR037C) [Zygosaccharomyces parabailii]CDH09426.1 related to DASH complex subunit SPC34 [Zygosaccharomyces bailii ISA1307]
MSETLDVCLEEITKSIDSINTLYFKPPGIFHNAVVHDGKGQSYSSIITKLIRDCNPREELSLFSVDPNRKIPLRKDGKEGVLDYLFERNMNLKRNRRIGLPDEKPVIHVPKEFYLKQHNQALAAKRQKTSALFFDMDTSTGAAAGSDPGIFELLDSKLNDREITRLLYALRNGSVTFDGKEEGDQRSTMFVEDFPTNLLLKVLEEVSKQWPLSEYKEAYLKYLRNYNDLDSEIKLIRRELQLQENQLQAQLQLQPSSSHVVGNLIEKEQKEVARLEKLIAELQNEKRK